MSQFQNCNSSLVATDESGDEEWQNGCQGLSQRYGELWRRGLWADCEFVVGASCARVVAHRVVLASASPVFAVMMYGSFAPTDGQHCSIQVSDMEIEPFRLMVEYIYSEDIKLSSCDVACRLYYGAHKYLLSHLQAVCRTYLLNNVTPTCVFCVYELSQLYEEEELMNKCLEIMKTRTSAVLEARPEEARLETLVDLLSMDSLALNSELQLFQMLEWYALAHAEETTHNDSNFTTEINGNHDAVQKEKDTKTDKTLTIRDALTKINFLTIEPEEYAAYDMSTLLSESEMLAIAMNLLSEKPRTAMPAGFSTSRKSRLTIPILLLSGQEMDVCFKICIEGDSNGNYDDYDELVISNLNS